ncbi:solute carrier family 2, facilitated glucose transporter member 3-like isoform X1 [Cylas formicarius]|uniref:solute carrier family 2, facilitated glucose transporter member 3-like isoform X1 n=1 Tax=Cylas formicarius TaxID=197179 RepID=UPI002958BE22|nr:solute carrier family 2, facilitated glucose transporter member 3-like isoform X1 [Cylas formicarius]
MNNIDSAAQYPRWTKFLVLAGIVTVIGCSTPVGYNIGVVNTPGYVIKRFCNESVLARFNVELTEGRLDFLWSFIVAIFLVGGAVGSLSGSVTADKIGRRSGLIVSSILGIAGALLFVTSKPANSVEMLVIGRIFVGLSSGLITTIMPMYLMELSPPDLKGASGALCPLGVTTGVLLGQILSTKAILGNESYWHYCLAFFGLLQMVCAFVIPFLPESPKYLFVIRDQPQLSLKELQRVRNIDEDMLIQEIEELKKEKQHNLEKGEDWNIAKVIRSESLLLPLLLICSLQAGQQLSGVNAVFYYSTDIFKGAGLSASSSELATIGAGCCNIFMAILSVQTMSWFKRRAVLQISLLSSTFFLVLLGLSISYMDYYSWMPYLCVAGVLGYVLSYGLGLGPIPYFVGSELFEVGPRSSAMALGSMANWGGNFLVGLTFPTLKTAIGATSFFIFAAFVIALFVFVRIYLPETKGVEAAAISKLVENGFKSKSLRPQLVDRVEMSGAIEKFS